MNYECCLCCKSENVTVKKVEWSVTSNYGIESIRENWRNYLPTPTELIVNPINETKSIIVTTVDMVNVCY